MYDEHLCGFCGKNVIDCQSSVEDVHDMFEAVRNNDLNRLKFLIQEGKSPNIHYDQDGYAALHEAVMKERADIVEYLLTLPDINLEQRTEYCEETPLLLSMQLTTPNIAKILIRQGGANLNAVDYSDDTILHTAVAKGSTEIVRFILNEGFDVNLTNSYDKTPLHEAVFDNDFEIVSMLLYYNADTDIIDCEGLTPFMTSLTNYNFDVNIQKEMFKYECDYNRETYYYGNTLYLAVKHYSPLIIDLIENGADVNYYCDDMNRSILGMTLETCDPEIFFYIFPLTNLSILTKFKQSIFTSLLKCNYNNENWLKVLYLILESNILSELIDHYRLINDVSLFGSFAEVFGKRNFSEDEFVKFIDICLCSGADVMFKDIEIVHSVYSNNKALPHLLNMKIENVPEFVFNLPDIFCNLPYIFCSFDINFARALDVYYKYDKHASLKSNRVQSLLELSRNKAIVAICTRYDIKSSHWYYYIVRRLNLPKIIYDYLTFKRLIE